MGELVVEFIGIQKISRLDVESIVAAAELKGRVLGIKIDLEEEDNPTPWKKLSNKSLAVIPSSELPEKLDLVVSNEIYIAKSSLSAPLKNKLIRMAAFQNPEFYKAQAMRLPVYDKPRIIGCAHDYSEHICLPNALWTHTLSCECIRAS